MGGINTFPKDDTMRKCCSDISNVTTSLFLDKAFALGLMTEDYADYLSKEKIKQIILLFLCDLAGIGIRKYIISLK